MANETEIQLNEFDYFKSNNELSLVTKCNQLSSFIIQTFIKDMKYDKIQYFYKCLPFILNNLYSSHINNEEDYWALLNLFTPNHSITNLFSVIIKPPYQSALNYVLEVSTISSYFTQNNFLMNNGATLLKELLGDILIINESTKHLYECNKCLMPLFEYFIFIFLISAKKVEYTSRKYLNVNKENKPIIISNYFSCSSRSKVSPQPLNTPSNKFVKDKELNDGLNINRSFQYNFYRSIFERYLNYFYDNGMKAKLMFIFKALDITWLYDYSIKQNSSSIILSKGKEAMFSLRNESKTPQCLSSTLTTVKQVNIKYPNLLLIDCLSLFVTFTYQKLEAENIFQFRKTLFSFMEFAFENKTTYCFTDVNMSDIVSLWLNYITPWNIQNEHTKVNQNKLFISQFINMNIPFYIILLDKCIQAFSLNKNSHKDFNELSKALCLFSVKLEQNKDTENKENVFNYFPFEQMLNYSFGNLKSFSGLEIIEKGLIDYNRNDINAKQIMMSFITNSQGRQAANKIIINNTALIQKLDNKGDNDAIKSIPDIEMFMNTLRLSNDILKELYRINNNENPQIQPINLIRYDNNQKQLYLQKIIFPDKNPWRTEKQADEISFLYYFFKTISQGIDRVRGIKKIEDNSINNNNNSKELNSVSLTNLRPLCNAFYLLNLLTIILIVFVLVYIIYYTANSIKLNAD